MPEVDEAHRKLEIRLHLRVTARRAEHDARHRTSSAMTVFSVCTGRLARRERVGRARIEG